ncbi:hypothetical protein Pst134EA_015169 [Puccinia striiformis f. sp. tritici]|nr:hypothetical protein Pst134EA_015169 [Puccinia striiformis f. sp. tritici]KAH9452337.1 hypothetical protein Pst134EB_016296 [Puccinia striiformis f. sp. tritici]KAH9463083.1 hypothetical protein Pst134EA_015169 [Puccinia striiformis f. sp. tritici]
MGRSFELSSYLNISEFNSLFPVECPITLILDLSQPETHPGIHQGLLHLVHISTIVTNIPGTASRKFGHLFFTVVPSIGPGGSIFMIAIMKISCRSANVPAVYNISHIRLLHFLPAC